MATREEVQAKLREIRSRSVTPTDTPSREDVRAKLLDIRKAPEPVEPTEPEKKPGFLKQVGGAVIKPFFKTGLTALRLGQAIKRLSEGDIKGADEIINKGAEVPLSREKVVPVGSQKSTIAGIKDIVGTGLDLGVSVLPMGAGKTAATKTAQTLLKTGGKGVAKEVTKQFLKQGAKVGAFAGAASGAGIALQDDKSALDVAKQTAIGTVTGGVLGAITGKIQASKFLKTPQRVEKLQNQAATFYKKGLGATKEKQKENVEKLIPVISENKWWGTRKALLKKAEKGIALSNKQYEQLGELQGVVEVDGILNKIDARLGTFLRPDGQVKSFKKAQYNALLAVRDDITSYGVYNEAVGNTKVYQQALRELGADLGKDLYGTRKALKTVKDSKTLSQLQFADASIRDLLASKNIEFAKINKLQTASRRLKEVLEETLSRTESRNWLKLIDGVSGAAGVGIGMAAAPGIAPPLIGASIMAGLTHIAHSGWFNTMSAVRKARIADRLLQKSPTEMMKWVTKLANVGVKAVDELMNQEQ